MLLAFWVTSVVESALAVPRFRSPLVVIEQALLTVSLTWNVAVVAAEALTATPPRASRAEASKVFLNSMGLLREMGLLPGPLRNSRAKRLCAGRTGGCLPGN